MMSKPIKFRAWDRNTKEWCAIDMAYADDRQGPISKPVVFDGRGKCVIQQYTGLEDKNGVEIYEGDVVEYEAVKGHIGVHQVIYEPKAAAFLLQAITRASRNPIGMKYLGDIARSNSQYDTRTYELCEVIGNIYENSDLLKEQS